MTAGEVFGQALLEVAEQGRATPCQGRRRDRWTSESAEEREWAATVCVTLACPVLEECAAAAAERKESFAVWGGVDYTLPRAAPHKQRRAASSSQVRRCPPWEPAAEATIRQPGLVTDKPQMRLGQAKPAANAGTFRPSCPLSSFLGESAPPPRCRASYPPAVKTPGVPPRVARSFERSGQGVAGRQQLVRGLRRTPSSAVEGHTKRLVRALLLVSAV